MTYLIERRGDLFTSDAPAQLQGVNIEGVMGHGIAPKFKRQHPEMYREYRELCLAGELTAGGLHAWHGPDVTIYNCASQDRKGRNARLEWVESSVRLAAHDADERGITRIAMPIIGCGVGGLNWADVHPILVTIAESSTVDLEVWHFTVGAR
jgi:O-acetyl-ADP-ribose deacetylase (regulator of RNase III)